MFRLCRSRVRLLGPDHSPFDGYLAERPQKLFHEGDCIMLRKRASAVISLIILLLWAQPLPGATTEQRLNELSDVIEQQQREIERLKQQLQDQQESIDEVREAERETIEETVEARMSEKEKTWSEWVPEWVRKTKVSGDLRLRYEGIYNREQRQIDGSTEDLPTRDRYRIRARLFFDSQVTDDISTHFMLCTNQDENREATTTNQSFADDFNDKGIYFHRAYATYSPSWFEGLQLTAGKFKNTFLHTDIMWDPDVNPEGVYERYQYRRLEAFQPFVHLGQMVLNEENVETDDAALFINQLGFDWDIGPVSWTFAASYYDWSNLHNTEFLHLAEYKGGGGNTFTLEDGVLQYLYDYNLMEALSFFSFKLGPVSTKLMFDYIVNTADDVPSDQDTAYFAGFKLGKEKKQGDMSLFYKYARIEKDSVIGSLNDQDFYGANRKGHKVKFRYLVFDQVTFATAYFHTEPVTSWDPDSVTFDKNKNREQEDRLQVEFVLKF